MLFLYFSGTGNTKYCVEYLARRWDVQSFVCSMEEPDVVDRIREAEEIVLGYPVYYSNLPKILRDFIDRQGSSWNGKKVFLTATMGAFSGDGTGVAARLLKKYGAEITGGLHLKMPDCILDVKALKRSEARNRELIGHAKQKMNRCVADIKTGHYPQEGLYFWNHIAGLFGQRLYFGHKTKTYTNKLKIDVSKCIKCGKCSRLCPMQNISVEKETVCTHGRCTMCYRCISACPKGAITLIGKKIVAKPFTAYEN